MKNFQALFTDTNYVENPQGTWQNAKNILFTKKFNSPVNENGTKFEHLIKGEVRGNIETNKEIVYFSIIKEKKANSLISVYNLNTKIVTEKLKGNFNFNRPIEGIYKYDYKDDLIVVWCDGVYENSNSPKIAKLTNIDLPIINTVLQDKYIPLIELFVNKSKGNLEAETIQGSIEGITAFVTFKYGRKNEETNFKDTNTYATLRSISDVSSNLNSHGIRVKLKDLNFELYEYVRIGLYIIGETDDKSYISPKIFINSSEKEIDINTIINYRQIASEQIIIPKAFFTKIETMTLHKDSILGLNVSKNNIFKFQKYANLLKIVPRVAGLIEPPAIEPFIEFKKTERFLMFNEVYSFKIQLDLLNGETTEWFHIPNLDFDSSELENIWNTEYVEDYSLENNRFNPEEFKPKFHLVNQGTKNKFGFWQNKSLYPNNDEYNSTIDYEGNPLPGADLRNTPIKFHRVMEEPRSNTGQPIEESFAIIGAMISNFQVIPIEVRKKIKSIRLGVAKRNFGNSLIIAEGLITPAAPQERVDDDSYKENDNVHLVQMSPAIPEEQYRWDKGIAFNHFSFLSPEIIEVQPLLSLSTIYFKRLIVADTYESNSYRALRSVPKEGETIDDNIEFRDPNNTNLEYDKNKYYNKPFSYDYKLPNNTAQGSKYVDGGLYMNNEKNVKNILSEETDFLPLTRDIDGNNDSFDKQFNFGVFALYNFNVTGAIINLMDFKDNLYTLREEEIVSSKNTIILTNNNIPNSADKSIAFKVGDVSFSKIKGNLSFVLDNIVNQLKYSSLTLNVKIISAFSSSLLKVKDTVYEDGEVHNIANEISITKLENKDYGFEVEGSIKNGILNTFGGYSSFDVFKTYIDKFPYRIIRSSLTPDEGEIINSLRTFGVNNYYELKSGKGDGVAIRSNDNEVYIQMRYSLLYAKIKDVLKTRDGEAYLQSRDLFDNVPITLTRENKGFIGCEHKFSCLMTKEGYIVIDHNRGNIIIATPEVKIISSEGVRNDLRRLLKFEENYYEIDNGIKKAIDDPYRFIGFSVGIDYDYNRIFFTKLYPELTFKEPNKKEYFNKLLENPNLEVNTIIKKENPKSFTLSYSLDSGKWLCYHDLIPSKYIEVQSTLYAVKNINYNSNKYNKGISHIVNKGNKGEYFGRTYESYIDLIFNASPDKTKIYNAITLFTEVNKAIQSSKFQKQTISKIVVFNEDQCSGEIVLDIKNKNIVREVEGEYRFNDFRDIVIDSSLPILNIEGELNLSNLNFNKNWFDKSYFISKFIVVRCIWDNLTNEDIYLNEIQVASKISQR